MYLIPLPFLPRRSALPTGVCQHHVSSPHIHNHFFLETKKSKNSQVQLLGNFGQRTKTVPFRLAELISELPTVRFLGIREAKYYRRTQDDILYEWTVNPSGLNLPIYFLGDLYADSGGREYCASLTKVNKVWKRMFTPTDVLVGGLGEFPKIPIYK